MIAVQDQTLLIATLNRIESDLREMRRTFREDISKSREDAQSDLGSVNMSLNELATKVETLMNWKWSVYGAATVISIISGGVMAIIVAFISR